MTDPMTTLDPADRQRSLVPGIVLILLGLFFFAINFFRIDFSNIWPVVLLVPAAVFFAMFVRDRRQYGFLMPATILTVYAVLFFICQNYDWNLMARLWPAFILAPGLGLLAMYLFGKNDPGLLIPASILVGVSGVFFVIANGFPEYWPAILVLIGIIILIRPSVWNRSSSQDQKPTQGS